MVSQFTHGVDCERADARVEACPKSIDIDCDDTSICPEAQGVIFDCREVGAPNFKRALAMGLQEPRSLEEWADFYPKFQRLPWIDEKRHVQIQRMRDYIRIAYGMDGVRRRSGLRQAANRLLAPIARARLDAHRYDLPLELWTLKGLSRVKNALGFHNVRTHIVQS